jgi:asparagine synthase (glutamine-hydrolysing)
MCGISVAINVNNASVAQELIKSINDKVAHRGPDDEGYHFGKNYALGHRRLSIIDLSQRGHQPMVMDGLAISFNGEIYNYIELREELRALGHAFHSESDTEVILAAYKEWGIKAFSKFNGMWAFALADESKKEVIFCRDQFGIKPIYYTWVNDHFFVGSEIKQFCAIDGFSPELNKAVAVNFVVTGLLNFSEETFFKGVKELRAGHCLIYDLSSHDVKTIKWYDLKEQISQVKDNFPESVDQIRKLMIDSVKLRMRSDVPVGSCLSGGIDSSTIISLVKSQNLGHPEFSTISSCFNDERHDEQMFSDLVTERTGFKSFKIFPDLNHLYKQNVLDLMLYHQDQPFSGGTHFLEYCVYKKARESNFKVMLGGQGCDEFLCGYNDFFYIQVVELLNRLKFKKAFKALRIRAVDKAIDFREEVIAFISSMYLPKLAIFVKRMMGVNLYPWLSLEWRTLADSSLRTFENNSIRNYSLDQIQITSLPYQLHSEDRNSMLFSIESRLPFLDSRLVEYCLGLPSSYKIKDGVTKAVLRDAITELPPEIKDRKHKMGFISPDEEWMLANSSWVRNELKAAILDTSIFTMDIVKKFDQFIEGEEPYQPIYFRAIAFNRFLKVFKMKIN